MVEKREQLHGSFWTPPQATLWNRKFPTRNSKIPTKVLIHWKSNFSIPLEWDKKGNQMCIWPIMVHHCTSTEISTLMVTLGKLLILCATIYWTIKKVIMYEFLELSTQMRWRKNIVKLNWNKNHGILSSIFFDQKISWK